jgi:hypothetical protein
MDSFVICYGILGYEAGTPRSYRINKMAIKSEYGTLSRAE